MFRGDLVVVYITRALSYVLDLCLVFSLWCSRKRMKINRRLFLERCILKTLPTVAQRYIQRIFCGACYAVAFEGIKNKSPMKTTPNIPTRGVRHAFKAFCGSSILQCRCHDTNSSTRFALLRKSANCFSKTKRLLSSILMSHDGVKADY